MKRLVRTYCSPGVLRSLFAVVLLVPIVALGQLPAAVSAAPGDLDPTFGTGGIVVADFGSGSEAFESVVLQADGKIVAAGTSGGDFLVARYNPNGSLDSTFGIGGKALVDFGSSVEAIHSVTLQSDGKILAVGEIGAGGILRKFALARLNTNGSLDSGFGSGGKVTTTYGGIDHFHQAVVLNDGKIVACGSVGGTFYTDVARDLAVIRYEANGAVDTSFGTSGLARTDLGGAEGCTSVAIQADGKIVAAGVRGSGPSVFVLARYNTDGSLDTSFNGTGTVTTSIVLIDAINSIAIQGDGKIVAAGYAGTSHSTFNFALVRYNTNGSLDSSFGSGGKVTTDFGSHDYIEAVALQSDGKIVAAGGTGPSMFAVARYNADGSLDSSFGTVGKVTTNLTAGVDVAMAVAIQADGNIIAAGVVNDLVDVALARYASAAAAPPTATPTFTFTPTVTVTPTATFTPTVTPTPASVTVTVAPAADTYLRNGADNTNEGRSTFVQVRSSGNHRSLVRFDQAAVQSAVGGSTLVSAKLRFTLTDNGENWGPTGRTVDAHRLIVAWTEGNGFTVGLTPSDRGTGAGATWACASDGNIANQSKDCSGSTEWEMGKPNQPELHPWVETPTGTVTIVNDQTGVVEWDVTADVAAFLSGSAPNHGWIVRKTAEGQAGMAQFGSRESAAPPQLVIVKQ